MAQTKRKRQTKHRGNAAGMIEARGGINRRGAVAPKKGDPKAQAAAKREARMNRVPTWRAAVNKAGIASVVFFVFALLALKTPVGGAVGLALVTFAIYVPLGYYTDRFVYQRTQKKRAAAKGRR